MSRLCEGRVCVITGAGRGIGREHALMLAEHGAKIVVNDLGGEMDGSGQGTGPAHDVVAEIIAMGGEAVANGDDCSDFAGAKNLIDQAVDTFGGLDVVVNNAGILRDRMLTNMTEAEWDAVIKVHLKGTFGPAHHAAAYWRDRSKAGEEIDGRIINTSSPSGIYGNVGPDQLRRGQGRHRRLHDHRGHGARALRRHRQRHRPGGTHPHDRGPRHGSGVRGAEGADVAQVDRADHHLAGVARVQGGQRPRVRRVRSGHLGVGGLAPRSRPRSRCSTRRPSARSSSTWSRQARPNADMGGNDKKKV